MNNIGQVIQHLSKEHREGFVYRGQVREYIEPLVPSGYRFCVDNRPRFTCTEKSRLRGVGNVFVEEIPAIDAAQRMSQNDFENLQVILHIRKYLRTALGYPLSQIFSQQAGMKSEGLDVTSDIDVAAFFATHDYTSNGYQLATDGNGIIYRFEVQEAKLNFDAIRTWDFYSCPSYLPSAKIINLFHRCFHDTECLQSIEQYRRAIDWGLSFDLNKIRNSRPFELIHLPTAAFENSRIVNQSAGLIIPDQILSPHWKIEAFQPSAEKMATRNEPAIEDLSEHNGVAKFRFKHGIENLEYIHGNANYYFPIHDIACEVVRNWFISFTKNPFGVIPLFFDAGSQLLWDRFIRDEKHEDPGNLFIF